MISYLQTVTSLLLLSLLVAAVPQPVLQTRAHDKETRLVRTLYQYPKGTFLENLAVRPSGELLVTLLNKPELHSLDPFETRPTPRLAHRFPGVQALTGISEAAPDTYAVAAGNFSLYTGAEEGTWSIWSVNLTPRPSVGKLASVPDASFLNGMTTIPSQNVPHDILVSDVDQGVVRRIDTRTGAVSIAVNNTLTSVASTPIYGDVGVNGIRIRNSTLYFANIGTGVFASVPIHADGTSAGSPTVIQKSDRSADVYNYDDFAIKDHYAYLVTGNGNSIEKISLNGTREPMIITDGLNSTQVGVPTSAAFGRTEKDKDILYVVTLGVSDAPVNETNTVGAQVLAIDTKRLGI